MELKKVDYHACTAEEKFDALIEVMLQQRNLINKIDDFVNAIEYLEKAQKSIATLGDEYTYTAICRHLTNTKCNLLERAGESINDLLNDTCGIIGPFMDEDEEYLPTTKKILGENQHQYIEQE